MILIIGVLCALLLLGCDIKYPVHGKFGYDQVDFIIEGTVLVSTPYCKKAICNDKSGEFKLLREGTISMYDYRNRLTVTKRIDELWVESATVKFDKEPPVSEWRIPLKFRWPGSDRVHSTILHPGIRRSQN